MRLIGPVPHPKFKVVAYNTERYYYVEIEAGPMKQCYKLPKEKVTSPDAIKTWLDEHFSEKTYTIFEEMYKNFDASLKRNF